MAILDLRIDQMHCGACVRRVSQILNALPATQARSVTVGAAEVSTDGSVEPLLAALAQAGYPAHVAHTRP